MNGSSRDGRRRARKGFSFTEVLFAVMILGIGFIMVAAIFPVAIQQTEASSEGGRAAAVARSAVAIVEQNVRSADLPTTGVPGEKPRIGSFRDPQTTHLDLQITGPPWLNFQFWPNPPTQPNQLWNKLKGDLVSEGDARYAWVMLYGRDLIHTSTFPFYRASPFAQIYIVVARVRTHTTYDAGTDLRPVEVHGFLPMSGTKDNPIFGFANLQPKYVAVAVDGAKQQIAFDGPFSQSGAVAEGCFVIISADNIPSTPPGRSGRMNGNVYRVSRRVTGNTWELMPGYEFVPDPGRDGRFGTEDDNRDGFGQRPRPATAFVLGRTFNPDTKTYEGPAQDVAVYTTFIQMR